MIDPSLMCDKHLFGEHGEIHKFRPSFVKGVSINGRIAPVVQIEPMSMKTRHDELTAEMTRRKNKQYFSEYEQPDLSKYDESKVSVKADVMSNIRDLVCRCENCKSKIVSAGYNV